MKKINIKKSELNEKIFYELLKKERLTVPMKEYRFCERRWRFDYAFPEYKIALEIEGGVWINGRHTRGKGYINDCEKYNRATILGWKVLRIVPNMLICYETIQLIKQAINNNSK